jgi:acetoacetate decarboxylase
MIITAFTLQVHTDTLVGSLDYGPVRVATATMGFKHKALDTAATKHAFENIPNFLLKIIPHVDGTARICELVKYHTVNVAIKGVWTGPVALSLFEMIGCHKLTVVVRIY